MAVNKFYDAYVYLAGTGLPPTTGGTALPHVHSITINRSADMLDISEMGVTTKINMAGLAEWSLDVECLNDFAGAAQVDSILGTIYAFIILNERLSPGFIIGAFFILVGSTVMIYGNERNRSAGSK